MFSNKPPLNHYGATTKPKSTVKHAMLRQAPLGDSRPSRSERELEDTLSSNDTLTRVADAESSHSWTGDSAVDIDKGHDSGDEEETLVHENLDLEQLPPHIINSLSTNHGLCKISFKGNSLRSVPDCLGALPNLYYLNLSHNKFNEVPPCIVGLSNLEILDMSSNSLSRLPSFLVSLPHLQGLSLVNNKFEVFPPVIADLEQLVILELNDNPIRVPSNILSLSDAPDEESWLGAVRHHIRSSRAEIENALQSGATNQTQTHADIGTGASTERMRSASESNVNPRAAKRMGFVMSRHATDQSYVANLHARGLSHDANILKNASFGKQPSQSSLPSPAAGTSVKQSAASTEHHSHARNASSLSSTLEFADLQPPMPRSPLSKSPFGSPWGSPRPSVTDLDSQASFNSRLSTLAEEHDADSEAGDTEVDSSFLINRESNASSEAGPTHSTTARPAGAIRSLPETVHESPFELSQNQQPLFKDSFSEARNVTSASTAAPLGLVGQNGASSMNLSSGVQTPSSATMNAVENMAFALEEVGGTLGKITSSLPPAIVAALKEAQEHIFNGAWLKALVAFTALLNRLTIPTTFRQVLSRISRRQQRQLASSIILAFPELESAWRHMQRSKLMPMITDSISQDEQLHAQLDYASKCAQSVLALLNNVVAKSAVAAADQTESTSEMALRVRDLSGVCIRCSSATRSVRALLDRQATTHARTLQLAERRRFWDDVNLFLKAVISTLATVRASLPCLPMLADASVGYEVAKLSRIAKEIPPLLEQSSYRVLLDSGGSAPSENYEQLHGFSSAGVPSLGSPALHFQQTQSQSPSQHSSHPYHHQLPPLNLQLIQSASSQVSLPPPTPLTASLGAAAQALISPGERIERVDGYV